MDKNKLAHFPLYHWLVKKIYKEYRIIGYSFHYYSDTEDIINEYKEPYLEVSARSVLDELAREPFKERLKRWYMYKEEDIMYGEWRSKDSSLRTNFNFIFKRR